jgi:hypothetical protein
MKRMAKTLAAILGAGLLMVVGAMFGPRTAHAVVAALVQIVPGTTTHVGQNESQLLSLRCLAGPCSAIDPGGNPSETVYVVPSGYTLIVTDWEWAFRGGTSGALSADYLLNGAPISNPGGGESLLVVASSFALPDGNGLAYAHEHYATGIRLGSGAQPYDFDSSNSINVFGEAFIQGYLVPND